MYKGKSERVLFVDIEMAPILAHTYTLREANISPSQIVRPMRVLCVGNAFNDEDMGLLAEWLPYGHDEMVRRIHQRLEEADIVVHYNGLSFDEKRLNAEFVKLGLMPPSYRTIDLYRTVRRNFQFSSNKLEQVVKELGLSQEKLKIGGMSLFIAAERGDSDACEKLGIYCMRDVELLREVYPELLPWINRIR